MGWLIGQWDTTWTVALKSVLLYATALFGLRLGTRRTLAQMSPFDFVVAVALGAVVGRTATASNTSFAAGAVAALALVLVHRLTALLRRIPGVSRLTDYRVRVVVSHGHVRSRQLWVCGLTRDDLAAELRKRGVTRMESVQYALYEHAGGLTVITTDPDGDLVAPIVGAGTGSRGFGRRGSG